MAQALLNRFGEGRFRAFSAGIEPAPELHPLTIEMLRASGLPTENLKPRGVSEFVAASAPRMDFVINVGKETPAQAPNWPDEPFRARWGITDPMSVGGDIAASRMAFRRAFRELENRIRLFVLVRHQPESARRIEQPRQARIA